MGPISAITGLVGAGMDIYGQLRQQHQQNWQNGLTMEQFNRRNAAQDTGGEMWRSSFDPARDTSLQLRDLFMAALSGDGGSQQQLSQLLQDYPGVMDRLVGGGSDPFGRGINGGMQSLMDQNAERRGAYTSAADQAFGTFANGGMTPGRQAAQDRFMDILNDPSQSNLTQGFQDRALDAINRGGMNDQLQRAWAGAGSLLDPEGATDTLDALQYGGLDMFGDRGMNDQNSALYDRGLSGLYGGALGTAGLTEAGGMAELTGLQDLQEGGRTDLSQALGGRGMDLANREALLPIEQVYQIAREDAARNTEGAFKRAQRQAAARKGTSGAVVAAGGAEGDPMSEWADLASRSVSDAGRQALITQQGLQLNQQGQGLGAAGNAGQLENARYGAAGDLVRGMEGNATQRYQADAGIAGGALSNALGYAGLGSQTALGGQEQETQRFLQALVLLPTLSNAAAGQMSAYGNLGLGAGQLEDARRRTSLSGGELLNRSQTDAGNYALGSGQLGMGLENSYQKAGDTLFDQYLKGGTFGMGLNQQELAAFQQLFNNTQGFNRDNFSNTQTGVNNLYNLGGQGLQYALGGIGAGSNYQPGSNQQSPYSAIGQAVGKINLSGLFNPKQTPLGTDDYGN